MAPDDVRRPSVAVECDVDVSSPDLAQLPHDALLTRTLALGTVIRTTSSFSRFAAQTADLPEHFVQIGEGMQGAVFEQASSATAIKKEHPHNASKPTNLVREYSLHRSVVAAFDAYSLATETPVRVPRVLDIIDETEYGEQNLHAFPAAYRVRGTIVQMERILPLPKAVRRALIGYFYRPAVSSEFGGCCPAEEEVEEILNHTPEKHCLVRTYLGRTDNAPRVPFSLRNFPLYLAQMERLRLHIETLAFAMGKAFAVMHWGAGVDGDDVEFALGTSIAADEGSGMQDRMMGLYLLDFGQCEHVNLEGNKEDVYQAFKEAMVTGDNQLFIPHFERSRELFVAFREGYTRAGEVILREKGLDGKFCVDEFMRGYEDYAEDFL